MSAICAPSCDSWDSCSGNTRSVTRSVAAEIPVGGGWCPFSVLVRADESYMQPSCVLTSSLCKYLCNGFSLTKIRSTLLPLPTGFTGAFPGGKCTSKWTEIFPDLSTFSILDSLFTKPGLPTLERKRHLWGLLPRESASQTKRINPHPMRLL